MNRSDGRRIVRTAAWIASVALTVGCSRSGDRDSAAASTSARTGADSAKTTGTPSVWNFDGLAVGQSPPNLILDKTGPGDVGRWIIRALSDAPSLPNVLSQEDDDRTAGRFALAVADAPSFGDVRVSVRCKTVGGLVDQACGIVWRYRDRNNYYLARANALENNMRFYLVQNGRRREIEGWNGDVASGVWHDLRADVRGTRVEIYFDGVKVIDARDRRLDQPGLVGVWTKADSRTLFDDLTAVPLATR